MMDKHHVPDAFTASANELRVRIWMAIILSALVGLLGLIAVLAK